MLMLGGFSVLLCLSILMSIFTPYPLGLSSIVHGRTKGFVTIGIAGLLCFGVLSLGVSDPDFYFFYLTTFCVSLVIALGLVEIIKREINPFIGILALGVCITIGAAGGIVSYLDHVDKSLNTVVIEEIKKRQLVLEELKAANTKEEKAEVPFELEALLAQPEVVAEALVKQLPATFLVWVFVMLWVNLFLMLKSHRIMAGTKNYSYNEMHLLSFKMPDKGVWFVIVFLVMGAFGEQVNPWLSTVGTTLLHVIGVFYFFQGFGIYLAFLDFVRLTGVMRTVLVVLTVMSAGQILAVIGLADMFIDFRKLMKKNKLGE